MMLNPKSRNFFVGTLLVFALTALAYGQNQIIDFNGISGGEGSQFTSYMEDGFTVSDVSNNLLVSQGIYGNPPPGLYFIAQPNQVLTGTVEVTEGGALFTFNSVDVYSSITAIPYTFTGFLNGNQVYTVSGVTQLAMGNFLTVMNPDSSIAVNTLDISVTNDPGSCCSNPMALDNINVTQQSATVPEPATLSLFGIGAAAAAAYRRKRGRS